MLLTLLQSNLSFSILQLLLCLTILVRLLFKMLPVCCPCSARLQGCSRTHPHCADLLSSILELNLPLISPCVIQVSSQLMEGGCFTSDSFSGLTRYACDHISSSRLADTNDLNQVLVRAFSEAPFETNPSAPGLVLQSEPTPNQSRSVPGPQRTSTHY